MAGGVGSRFWPMSTADNPKQFIDVLGVGKTLLQLTVDRFETIIPKENVWVVTNQKYMDIVSQQLPEMPQDWAQSPIPNPQSPIPNPQSPYYYIIPM